jgi:outer membrane biosynthesis protein TonB
MIRPGSRRRRRDSRGRGVAFFGTVALHGAVVATALFTPATHNADQPPVYRVELVAAPAPQPNQRRAPEAVERPAEQPAPVAVDRPRRSSVAETPPPPVAKREEREPAPRTNPVEPAPNVKPSTGTDVATVKTSGVDFQYPEYLRNIVAQIHRRWHRPGGSSTLSAEILFFVRRDGSISNLQFVRRSGSFAFDLEAQGAIEAAGTADAFGPLPDGYDADVLPVSFFFDPDDAP